MHPHSKLSLAIAAMAAARSAEPWQRLPLTLTPPASRFRKSPSLRSDAAKTSRTYPSPSRHCIRYLPNVTAPSAGPGQAQIFMRGLSVGSDGTQSGGSISGFPNVAIYLDDQSGPRAATRTAM